MTLALNLLALTIVLHKALSVVRRQVDPERMSLAEAAAWTWHAGADDEAARAAAKAAAKKRVRFLTSLGHFDSRPLSQQAAMRCLRRKQSCSAHATCRYPLSMLHHFQITSLSWCFSIAAWDRRKQRWQVCLSDS